MSAIVQIILAVVLVLVVIVAAGVLYYTVRKTSHELIIETPEPAKVFIGRNRNKLVIDFADLEDQDLPEISSVQYEEIDGSLVLTNYNLNIKNQEELIMEYQDESTTEERRQEILDVFTAAREKYMYRIAYETIRRAKQAKGEDTSDEQPMDLPDKENGIELEDKEHGGNNPEMVPEDEDGAAAPRDSEDDDSSAGGDEDGDSDGDDGSEGDAAGGDVSEDEWPDEIRQAMMDARATAEDHGKTVDVENENLDFENTPWGEEF